MAIIVTSNEATAPTPEPVAEETKPAPDKIEAKPEDSETPAEGTEGLEPEAEGEEPKVAAKTEEEIIPKGVKKRLDKMAKQKGQAERRATQAELERDYYKEQFHRSQKPTTTTDKPQTVAKEDGPPKQEDYTSMAEWLDARDAYRDKLREQQIEAKLKERELKSEQSKVVETFKEKVDSFRVKNPDWDEVMEAVDDVTLSPSLIAKIQKDGPELAYNLAKDPETLKRINALSHDDAMEAIGEFKAKYKAATTKKVETTKAPTPIKPVGTGTASVVHKSLAEVAKNGSQQDYEAMRREQRKNRQLSW